MWGVEGEGRYLRSIQLNFIGLMYTSSGLRALVMAFPDITSLSPVHLYQNRFMFSLGRIVFFLVTNRRLINWGTTISTSRASST